MIYCKLQTRYKVFETKLNTSTHKITYTTSIDSITIEKYSFSNDKNQYSNYTVFLLLKDERFPS